jgi:hypothetical protein
LNGKIKNYKNFGKKKAKGKEKEIKSRKKLKIYIYNIHKLELKG